MINRIRTTIKIASAITVLALAGCETVPEKVLEPTEPLSYSFAYTPPEPPSKKLDVAIGIIAADWGKPSVQYTAGFSPQSAERLIKPDLKANIGLLPQQLRDVLQEFDRAVNKEYEAMMVRRGFNTMSFKKLDDMTYPQKQACNLVLFPEFHLAIKDQPEDVQVHEVRGQARLTGEIVLNILEPMSREKLWMKRLNLQSEPFPFKYTFKWTAIANDKGETVGYDRSGIEWDNRAQRAAGALTKFFAEIMDTSWKYFSPEELMVLKKHSDEIRERKRF